MPIVAIEGPDKCGKSTLFAKLQNCGAFPGAKFIDAPSFKREQMCIAHILAARDLQMWELFHDPRQLYVCNRHTITSDAVYSALYCRPGLRPSPLEADIGVLYIDVRTEELQRRHSECKEEVQNPKHYALVKQLYEGVLQRFPHARVHPYTCLQGIVSSTGRLVDEVLRKRN